MLHYQSPNIEEHKVAIIGIGGTGANILQCFSNSSTNKVELITMDLDERIGKGANNLQFLQLGKTLTHGMGSGGDPSLGQQAAEESHQSIIEHLSNKKLIVLIVGLGGGTGSGAAPYIAQIAKDMGIFLVTVSLMPFSFEGRRRVKQAQDALDQLTKESNILFCFNNDSMEELSAKQTGARAVFEKVNQLLARAAATIPMIANSPGLINIGLDDLSKVLETRNSRSLFGIGVGNGVERVEKAVARALKSPLMSYSSTSEYIQRILVHITGDESLSMSEVRQSCELIREAFPDRELEIFLGASTRPNLQDELRISLIASINNETLTQSINAQIIATMEAEQSQLEELKAQKNRAAEEASTAFNTQLEHNIPRNDEEIDLFDTELTQSEELHIEDDSNYINYGDESILEAERNENFSPYEQIQESELIIEGVSDPLISATTRGIESQQRSTSPTATDSPPSQFAYRCEEDEELRYAPPSQEMPHQRLSAKIQPKANNLSQEIELPKAILRTPLTPSAANKPQPIGKPESSPSTAASEQPISAFDSDTAFQYSDEDDLDIPPSLRKH